MKVEFLVNTGINDGLQLLIKESEFSKANTNDDEFYSFAFATEAFFSRYGVKRFIDRKEYDYIKTNLKKGDAVIISAYQESRFRVYPDVYISRNQTLYRLDLNEVQYEE